MASPDIYQIFYNEETKAKLEEGFIPFDNSATSDAYFENRVLQLVQDRGLVKEDRFTGVVSPSFKEKRGGLSYKDIEEAAIRLEGVDLVGFSHPTNNQYFKHIPTVAKCHPQASKIYILLLNKLGIRPELAFKEEYYNPYNNFWMGSPRFFKDYVNKIVKPSMHWMETDPKIKKLIMQDARYFNHTKNAEVWMKLAGVPHATHHTFILERLPGLFAKLRGYTIASVKRKGDSLLFERF